MTNPEETPGSHLRPTAADAQRGAALIVHHARKDADGCNAIIMQAMTEDDPGAASTRLLFAVLEIYEQTVPLLHTKTGLAWLTDVVVDLAGMDPK